MKESKRRKYWVKEREREIVDGGKKEKERRQKEWKRDWVKGRKREGKIGIFSEGKRDREGNFRQRKEREKERKGEGKSG